MEMVTVLLLLDVFAATLRSMVSVVGPGSVCIPRGLGDASHTGASQSSSASRVRSARRQCASSPWTGRAIMASTAPSRITEASLHDLAGDAEVGRMPEMLPGGFGRP